SGPFGIPIDDPSCKLRGPEGHILDQKERGKYHDIKQGRDDHQRSLHESEIEPSTSRCRILATITGSRSLLSDGYSSCTLLSLKQLCMTRAKTEAGSK